MVKETPQLHYTLECTEHASKPHYIGQKRRFYINRKVKLPDEMLTLRWANIKKEQAENVWGGEWIIIINDYLGKPEPVKQGNLLYGAEAKRQAYMIILDGPDTAGRRWLRRLSGIDPPLPKSEDKLNFG